MLGMSDSGLQSTEASGVVSTRAWWTLAVLTFVSILEWADRALMSVVAEPVKEEFELSDTELGFLLGFAFVSVRVLIAIPVGRLADTWNRRNLLAIALAIWSSATMAMGMARSYLESIAARLCVGAGTSGSYPPTVSMLADLFPLKQRGLAMGIWSIGSTVGFSLGVGIGGIITSTAGWRAAMIYFSVLGIGVALLLVFVVREPTRRDSSGSELATQTPPSLGEVFAFVRRQRSLLHVTVGFVALSIVDISIAFWSVSYFVRSHGLDVLEASSLLATVWLIAGIPGTLLGGYLMDRLARRDIRWHAWMIACICLATIVPAPFIYLSPSVPMALTAVFVSQLIWTMWFAPQVTVLTGLVGSRTRAIAWAAFSITAALVGQGVGPQLIGAISDLLTPHLGVHALRYALLTGMIFQVWAAWHFYCAAKTLTDDYERASRE